VAAIPIQIDGVFFPHAKGSQPVKGTMLGQASIYGLGIGGGPIFPPPDGGGGTPDWPPPHPEHPIWGPPGFNPPGPGMPPGIGGGPIIPVPPETPNLPPPGSPPVHLAGTQPVQPVTPPAAVVIQYPGIGRVLVPQPTQSVQIPVPPVPTPAPPGATPA